MKKGLAILTSVVFGLVLFTGSAMAYDFGTNITIWDKAGSGDGWHGVQEDEEIEPGSQTGQVWDLEGFFLNGSELTMVGGFDFLDGYGGYASGDIFIDVDGDAQFGDPGTGGFGNDPVNNTFGYDFVFDIDWTTGLYSVFELDANSMTQTIKYSVNQESNPWRFVHGNEEAIKYNDETVFNLITYDWFGDTDHGLNFEGDYGDANANSHNAVTIDLGFLDVTKFTAHFTMECGNDNLMGNPVPEPSTIILLGLGILGLVGFRKKYVK